MTTRSIDDRKDAVQPQSPILVTGSHRSGTTWLGRILSLAHGFSYVHEPWNPAHPPGVCAAEFPLWFTYVTEENEAAYLQPVQRTLQLRYDIAAQLRRGRGPSWKSRTAWNMIVGRLRADQAIIKDPIAFFSTPWLSRQYGVRPVIMVRHPAAFAASLIAKNWQHPFDHFLKQPQLVAELLFPFADDLDLAASRDLPILDQAILLWRIVYSVAAQWRQEYPDWIFVRHEDLSRDPEREFRHLFERLDLRFTPQVELGLSRFTNSKRVPVPGSEDLARNSRANIDVWRTRLSGAEQQYLLDRVADTSSAFYSDEELR